MKKKRFQLRLNQVYIMPTGFGSIYALSLFMMLLMAYTYQSNLAYGLTFFLGSFGLAAMFATHRQMARLQLSNTEVAMVEEGQSIRPPLRNPNPEDAPEAIRLFPRQNSEVTESVGQWFFQRRGIHEIPVTEARSTYPMGLFRTWKRIPTKTIVYCYPRCEDQGLWPAELKNASGKKAESTQDAGELAGLTGARAEDPASSIDWRALARGRGWARKEFRDDGGERLRFRWQDTASLEDPEKRLRQMSAWIRDARANRLSFLAEMPNGRWTFSEDEARREMAGWVAP